MNSLKLKPGLFSVGCKIETSGAIAAANDLARDFGKVLGVTPTVKHYNELITLSLDETLDAETFRITVEDKISICGGNELGVIYGIYEFSHRFLDVDPLWFWKELEPARCDFLEIPRGIYSCEKPVFRFRGWFINDEDLLVGWKEASGQRFQDWPKREEILHAAPHAGLVSSHRKLLDYYTDVPNLETMEMVYEAALRLRANLMIPASFLDIMNEPEANLVRRAVRRGLYVSQHHIEPLGVSFFNFETWWAKQGQNPAFSYRQEAAAMRDCWRAYAQRWAEVAGARVVWQVGLRGRGDRPLWEHDPEAKAKAPALISSALAEQMTIIAEVDSRPQPPATLTLWQEGAELVMTGQLRVPEGVICIFADNGLTQEMQQDFHAMPRETGRGYGFYYHVAVWNYGPHLVQGPWPSKVARVVQEVAAKGDTAYGILNTANVREHIVGITVWMEQMWSPQPLDDTEFLLRWAPEEWLPFYRELLGARPEVKPNWFIHDSSARCFAESRARHALLGKPIQGTTAGTFEEQVGGKICESVRRLENLHAALREYQPPERWESFFQANLVAQTGILLGLYRCLEASFSDPPQWSRAADSMQAALDAFQDGEFGRWKGWYRTDKKLGLADILATIREVEARESGSTTSY